ncbi:MAG: DUF1320 domain-containing protein [Puniceicoccaceae bacterium]|nr:MAG: DUF1320 domain-containing protein [Puniceicoccaceae bacterium]
MIAWITLTTADIEDYLVGAQVSALRTAALSPGQGDPVSEAIADISAEIRNYIRGCSSNVLSATAGTIPPELKRHAAALIIEAAQPRLKLRLSDDQKDAAENARRLLRDIAACKYPVASPTDPESQPADQGATVTPTISGRTKRYGRDSQDGI